MNYTLSGPIKVTLPAFVASQNCSQVQSLNLAQAKCSNAVSGQPPFYSKSM